MGAKVDSDGRAPEIPAAEEEAAMPPPHQKTPSRPGDIYRGDFVSVAAALDGAGHFIGITKDGEAYTWGRTNSLGQLGRSQGKARMPCPIELKIEGRDGRHDVHVVNAYAGGFADSGHTAIKDSQGYLWLTGCDRWQQLGLGSSHAGASGYTWKGGRLWQETFQRNDFLTELIRRKDPGASIKDVALGGDHTVVLSSSGDVITFGKGGEGQLGLPGKPFVSSPARSKELSKAPGAKNVSAVCAVRHCSLTLDEAGGVLKKAGKCRMDKAMVEALKSCQSRAKKDGLFIS